MLRIATLATLLLFAGLAAANPLLAVTPSTAAVVLEIAPDAAPPPGLVEALAGIGWGDHLDTLTRLAEVLDADLDFGEDPENLMADLLEEVAYICPPLADALEGVNPASLFGDALLSVHLNPFNPVPQLLAIARPSDPEAFAAVQDAVIACFGGQALEQDGVALEIVFDGSEFPLVLARHEGYFFAASDPNLSRWVVRQLAGAGEASLADAPLGQALEQLGAGGWGIGADLGALAPLIDLAQEAVPPELLETIESLKGTLTSIGVVAARVGWDAAGLRAEGVQFAPLASGTSALDALLGESRAATLPPFLPQGSVALSSAVVPWSNLVAAIDELLVPLGAALGEPLDMRMLASGFLGLDLDSSWLAWAGDHLHTVTLAPLGTDLRGWLQGAPTLLSVPVLDEELARAALPDLIGFITTIATVFDGLSTELMGLADPFGATPSLPPADQLLVTRETIYGVSFDRIRVGPSIDFGLTVLDGHLLVVSPLRAARTVLQHREGFGSLLQDPVWAEALAAWPQGARSVAVRDTQRELRALSDVADLLAQPLVWFLQLGLLEASSEDWYGSDDWWMDDDDWWMDDQPWWLGDDGLTPPPWYDEDVNVDLDTLRPAPLVIGYTIDAELTDEQTHRLYDLLGTAPGMILEVEMLNPNYSFDTYLYLLDADSGEVLLSNDDAPSTDRSFIAFMVEPDVRYQVLATSYGGWQTGSFSLSVNQRIDTVEEEAAPLPEVEEPTWEPEPMAEIPTFAELLALAGLLPRTIDVVADATGLTWSVTRFENGMTITRIVLPLR
jgi:hypothetical protein